VLIAGPTASGKSVLAVVLARATDGVVINADSMQVYRDLRILTARPTPEQEARASHRLYGYVDAAVNCSVGIWLDDAQAALADAERDGRLPVFVGGTGLYFKALLRGLSAIPPVPQDIRDAIRARLEREGIVALHRELSARDPVAGARLKPRDRARVPRALEVLEATGKSIGEWHAHGLPSLLKPDEFRAIFLAPDRAELHARIDQRFARMMAEGALDEVSALASRRLDPMLPAMKALGVPPLLRHLRGEITRDEAIVQGSAETRQYAKRQFTWFRHQLPEFQWVAPASTQNLLGVAKTPSPSGKARDIV
jgi:tRNA dimethylallyltransferase